MTGKKLYDKKKHPENEMKKILCALISALFILTACQNEPAVTEPETTSVYQTDRETVTEALPETRTVTEQETTEAETEPETASVYGRFKFTENLINPSVTAPYAILINAGTDEILYINCDPQEKIYPASTTKVLTAIVALKNCEPDVVFKPGDELSLLPPDSSIAYIKPNHELTLEMLIEGMMLPSGGDAAYVVAAGVGRIIAKDDSLSGKEAVAVFMDEMNRYGKEELGLTGTHFTCPDGYHDDDHYTTIIDIMTIARAALDERIIMKYAATYEDDVRYASGHKNTWTNTNKLIDQDSPYFYENATGLKTGTTDEAGCCLLASAALGTKRVIAGVFGAKDNAERFSDARSLLLFGMNKQ